MIVKYTKYSLLLIFILFYFMHVEVSAAAQQLRDVKGHWASGDITSMTPYIGGYPDGTFKPNGNITRAEFVSILSRILKVEDAANPFSDGSQATWANNVIGGVVQAGLIDKAEYGDTFKPNQPITRREMSKMIALAFANKNPEYKELLSTFNSLYYMDFPFVDAKKFAKADMPYVALAFGTGIVGGDTQPALNLTNKATRAEATAMLNRLVKNIDKAPTEYRKLQELVEVAKTGSNMTTVSKLVPKMDTFTGITVENAKLKAELNRIYVMPLEGVASLFETKFIWDRNKMPEFYRDRSQVKGLTATVVNVTLKQNINIYYDYIQKLTVSSGGMFLYDVPKNKFGLIDYWELEEQNPQKGKTYEIVVWGYYGVDLLAGDFYIQGTNSSHYLFFKKQGEY